MRDLIEEPGGGAASEAEAGQPAVAVPCALPSGIELHNRDFMTEAARLPDASIDLIVADPPYGLGKDYGNDSDKRSGDDFLAWTRAPGVKLAETLLVLALAAHLAGGVRLLFVEFVGWRANWQKSALAIAAAAALAYALLFALNG